MICTSAFQSYLCYTFYKIADNNLNYYILEKNMFNNLKCVNKISILRMNFHFHIIEAVCKLQLAIKCCEKIFQNAYKRLTFTGVYILFSSIYIALGLTLCSFISVIVKLCSN